MLAQIVLQRLRELKEVAEQLARRMGEGEWKDSTMERERGGEGKREGGGNGIGNGIGNGRRGENMGGAPLLLLPGVVREQLVARVRRGLVAAWEELGVVLREGQRGGGGGLY